MFPFSKFVANLFVFAVICCHVTSAKSDDATAQIYTEAIELGLEKDPVWSTILGYEEHGLFNSRRESAFRSSSAFLHIDGKSNPSSELHATLSAFFEPVGGDSNEHAQCKYRARYIWLDAELDLKKYGLEEQACDAYEEWKRHEAVNSISVLMVGGFLENPASYFGHNMIKLNTSRQNSNNLQNESINFGADIPQEDGIFKYIYSGITGKYRGVFSSSEYFHFANNYGETEHRDIWEYQLNLTDYEVSLLLGLVWELMQTDFTYYFFDKNCAYRMARLFNILRGIDLTTGHNIWYAPQTFVQRMASQSGDKQIFDGSPIYHPSRQSRFYNRYYDLSPDEQSTVKALIRAPQRLAASDYPAIELPSKYRVLDVLLDYYQYTSSDGQGNITDENSPYTQVLAERYRLPAADAVFTDSPTPSPHQSRDISYSAITYSNNSTIGSTWRFRIRPAYYDALDHGAGHVPNAALSMAELELIGDGDEVNVRRFSLIKIESVNLKATGLPGDSRRTWLLEVGAAQDRYSDIDSTVGIARAQIGRAYPVRAVNGVIAARLGGALQSSYRGSGYGYLSAGLTASGSFTERLRFELSAEFREGLSTSHEDRLVSGAAVRYEVSRYLDIRLLYERNVVNELGLSVGAYW
ncbi:MAG: DUF4105 domain-containing protein [Pseudohongiella sp.]|uniref:DUF4105 domain-containing protein n=1 Tax=Pseudohongiella sp. TaxID=1979412 RepID=UPI0034A06444